MGSMLVPKEGWPFAPVSLLRARKVVAKNHGSVVMRPRMLVTVPYKPHSRRYPSHGGFQQGLPLSFRQVTLHEGQSTLKCCLSPGVIRSSSQDLHEALHLWLAD